MTLHAIYESAAGTTTDLAATDHVRLPNVEVTANAEEGSVAQSQLLVEDSGGALDIVGLKRLWLWESGEDAGNQMIWTGTTGDREIGRDAGGEEPFLVGADRRWSCGLVEANSRLSRRLITGSDGNRPAETDIARLTWLIGSTYLAGVENSLGYLDTSHAVDLSAADLRGQSAYDVVSDCANRSNKNFHLVYHGDTSPPTGIGTYSLVYAFDYMAQYTSSLRLTNVLADVDNSTTFAVSPDMTLRRTPERVYSGVVIQYVGGSLYAQNTTTGNAFAFRDTTRPAVNISTAAEAQAQADTYLNSVDTEEDRITCRFTVPNTKVNHLREGQRVQIKFSHLPNYSSAYTYARCVRRIVRQLADDFYELTVELVPQGATTSTGAQLMRPNSNNDPGGVGGTFLIDWDYDGDNWKGGDTGYPLSGLIQYVGALGERTALRVLGSGNVTITLAFSVETVYQDSHTFTAAITVNGVAVATYSNTASVPGLNLHILELIHGTALVATDVAVVSGDLVQFYLTSTPSASQNAVPWGVGNADHMLRVTGALR